MSLFIPVSAPKAPLIDRVIGWLSPKAGLERARARAATHYIRSYDGARKGRRTDGWQTAGGSANAEILPALSTLRNRSRDLRRNNGYVRAAIRTLVRQSVGLGIIGDFGPDAALWDQWRKECDADGQLDFDGLIALAVDTMFEAGEVIIRLRYRRPEDGLSVPLQLQVLEPDFIDSSKTMSLQNGGQIIAGVEFDPLGRRSAYWLFPQHPGEVVLTAVTIQSKRVDVAEIIHLYEKERPGQVRGVPRAAAIMMTVRDLDDYEEASLVRKGMEACIGMVVTSPDDLQGGVTGGALTDASGARIESLAAGMIVYGKPGQQVQFGDPKAVSDFDPYTGAHKHKIATGMGVTYEQMTGDLSQVNYSSIQAGQTPFRRDIDAFRWLTLVPMALDPIAKAWQSAAYLAGKSRRSVSKIEWTMPKWDMVDALKEVKASREEVSGGQVSWSERIRQRGYDPDKVRAEIAADVQAFISAGIPENLVHQILFTVGTGTLPSDGAAANGNAQTAN